MASRTMLAARRHGNRRVTVEQRPVPRPGPGEVLVAMRPRPASAAPTCTASRLPEPGPAVLDYVPGHEPCGVVAEVGPEVSGWAEGDRVVVYHRYTCRRCRYCLAGQRNLCPYRDPGGRRAYGANPDGADAEYMVAHAADLMPLAPDFDFLDGAVLACQAGTAYYGLRHIRLDGTDRLLVTGLGPVGLLAFMFARAMGAETIGVDPSPDPAASWPAGWDCSGSSIRRRRPWRSRRRPPGRTGATAAGRRPPARGPSTPPSLPAAAINARVAIIGLGRSAPALSLPSLMGKQITVVASNLWPYSAWEEIGDIVRRKAVPIRQVVTHELPIEEAPRIRPGRRDRGRQGRLPLRVGSGRPGGQCSRRRLPARGEQRRERRKEGPMPSPGEQGARWRPGTQPWRCSGPTACASSSASTATTCSSSTRAWPTPRRSPTSRSSTRTRPPSPPRSTGVSPAGPAWPW